MCGGGGGGGGGVEDTQANIHCSSVLGRVLGFFFFFFPVFQDDVEAPTVTVTVVYVGGR